MSGQGQIFKHYIEDASTAELPLKTIIAVNLLSSFGAVANFVTAKAWRILSISKRTTKYR